MFGLKRKIIKAGERLRKTSDIDPFRAIRQQNSPDSLHEDEASLHVNNPVSRESDQVQNSPSYSLNSLGLDPLYDQPVSDSFDSHLVQSSRILRCQLSQELLNFPTSIPINIPTQLSFQSSQSENSTYITMTSPTPNRRLVSTVKQKDPALRDTFVDDIRDSMPPPPRILSPRSEFRIPPLRPTATLPALQAFEVVGPSTIKPVKDRPAMLRPSQTVSLPNSGRGSPAMGYRPETPLLPLQSTSIMATISQRQSPVAEQEQTGLPVRQLGYAPLESFSKGFDNISVNPAVSTVTGTEMILNNEAQGVFRDYKDVSEGQYLASKSGAGLNSDLAHPSSSMNLRPGPVIEELVGADC